MRKWIGEKAVKSLSAFSYTVVNDDWEATVEVDRNDIKDDQLGIYGPQAQMAGQSAKQLPDELIFTLVNGAFTSKCYDGQYFYDTDHPIKKDDGTDGVMSNMFDVPLTIDSLVGAIASYGAARTAMQMFPDDEGRPLGIDPTILLVGPALRDIANALMTADRLQDGTVNIYKGTAEVVSDPRIKSPTFWTLLDTSKPVMPFIYQEREAPEFVQQTDMQSDQVFKRKKYSFGAEARAAAGYGFWQLAFGSTGSGAKPT
jgi:phage major head subunit gpT-like protein